MRVRLRPGFVLWLILAAPAAIGADQRGDSYRLVASESSVIVHVGTSGLLSFAGHDHEVSAPAMTGAVEIDPANPSRSAVTAEFRAASLKVTGRGEPPSDIPEVQRTMLGERVLDVERFPVITFRSTSVSASSRGSGSADITVRGDLTLHGVTRPVSVTGTVTVAADVLTLRGRSSIRQTDFGIRPVTAGAGTVRVKNDLAVELTIVARTGPK